MKTIITLVVEDLSEKDRERLALLFRDAFGEFVSHRGPTAAQYVTERYNLKHPNPLSVYSKQSAFEEKVRQVEERCELANKIHNAELDIRYETDPWQR